MLPLPTSETFGMAKDAPYTFGVDAPFEMLMLRLVFVFERGSVDGVEISAEGECERGCDCEREGGSDELMLLLRLLNPELLLFITGDGERLLG